MVPTTAHQTMLIVGVIEIIAGLAVAIKPRYGALLVSAWLAGIVINLFSYPGFYDIALRDFGLLLAALTLARLASVYDPPGGAASRSARAADTGEQAGAASGLHAHGLRRSRLARGTGRGAGPLDREAEHGGRCAFWLQQHPRRTVPPCGLGPAPGDAAWQPGPGAGWARRPSQ